MVAPAIVGAAIAGGSALLGGVRSDRANRRAMEQQTQLQKDFAQQGIRWRVEDAKAAGLHPLYALGAQLPSFSPMVVPDSMGPAISQAGQELGRAVQGQQSPAERRLQAMALLQAEANLKETDARRQMYLSEAYRNMQTDNVSGGVPFGPTSAIVPEGQAPKALQGMVEVVPREIPSASVSDPAMTAGVAPFFDRFQGRSGVQYVLPSSAAAESLESVTESVPLMLWTLRENLKDPTFRRVLLRHLGKSAIGFLSKIPLRPPRAAVQRGRGPIERR